MTTSSDPDQIRDEIARTRAELSDNVDTLSDTANPKNIANRQVNKVKGAVSGVKDTIMGSPDDPHDTGRVGDLRASASDTVSGVGDAVSGAPATVKQKAQGNPLAAGLIAFGVWSVGVVTDPVVAAGAGCGLGAAGEFGAVEAEGVRRGEGDGRQPEGPGTGGG